MPKYPAELAVLRTLLDAFPTAVLVVDDTAHYLTANRAACALLGRTSEQVVGLRVGDMLPPERRDAMDAQWQAFLRDGTQSGIMKLPLPGGGERVVQFDARANFMPGLHCSFLVEVAPATRQRAEDGELPMMCAWTKQMRVRGTWVTIEEYLEKEHGVVVSHGISPDAFEVFSRDFPSP